MRRALTVPFLALALAPRAALADTVSWVDWQSYTSTDVYGQATALDGTVVDVTYTGEYTFVQTACGTNYWARTSGSTYLSATVDNAPDDSGDSDTMCDIIALHLATSKTLTFSEPVTNPLFAVVSLNGNGYSFDRDFDILSYGIGYWGSGTLTKTSSTASDGTVSYELNGSGEPHGVIQFIGTFSDVTWTSMANENWNGFGIAIENVAAAVPPEIEVYEADGTAITDEQTTAVDFGTVDVGDSLALEFTVENTGAGPLNFSDLRIEGSDASAYAAGSIDLAIDAGDSTSFEVTFTPDDAGDFDATVVIDSDDADEAEFSFPITGTGFLDTDGDGVGDDADNCPETSNPDQDDLDLDGTGDACDDCVDVDGDGYGESTDGSCAEDCDDADADVNPGTDELCDGVDNDCDGTVDEDDAVDASTWYADADGDGFGDPASTDVACDLPTGYVADATDCDDSDAATHPGADEYCDGHDDDCDAVVDEDDALDASTWYADADGDGFGDPASTDIACDLPTGYVADATDCDDSDAATHPGADEYCDGHDDDCDGLVDEDDAVDASTWYADADGDGFGDPASTDIACEQPSGYVADATDCDDSDVATHPGAEELWYDGVDQACDGGSDYDQDGDGFDLGESEAEDCDDEDAEIHPDAKERWYDGVDQDCDGLSDYDMDGDGYDSETYGGDDCDDADELVYPGAPDEPYDGVINDCDHVSDYDADQDGHDAEAHGGDDCDDANSSVNPDEEEVWYDGVDQDCDDNDDDQDEDGWPLDEDCDDTDPDVWPGAEGWTEDCEPVVDSGDSDEPGDSGDFDDKDGDCGCSGGVAPAAPWLLLVPLLVRRRRAGLRRRPTPST